MIEHYKTTYLKVKLHFVSRPWAFMVRREEAVFYIASGAWIWKRFEVGLLLQQLIKTD